MSVSRTERRTRAQVAASAQPNAAGLTSYGIAPMPLPSTKWYAFKCVDGVVTALTPKRAGELRGEGKWPASARLVEAVRRHLAGVEP